MVRIPDVAVGLLDPDQEARPRGGLPVDRVERPDRIAGQLRDGDAVRAGLVDVLPPLLAQVSPQRLLAGREVDQAGRWRLDRRRRAPAGTGQDRPKRTRGIEWAVALHLRVDPDVRDAPRQPRPQGGGEAIHGFRVPRARHRAAGRVRERPGQRSRPAQENLGPDRRGAPGHDTGARPAVHCLDPRPCGALQVRAQLVRLHEGVPGCRLHQGRRPGHAAGSRRSAELIRRTIVGTSGIRSSQARPR